MARPNIQDLHGLTFEQASDSKLLGYGVQSLETRKGWLTLGKAIFNEPFDAEQEALYRQCTGNKDLRTTTSSFVWAVVGRRGGKSFWMADIASYLALCKDWQKFLSPGERAVVMIIAVDRQQAKIIKNYISAKLNLNPVFKHFIESETAEAIHLSNSVSIEIQTCSYRSVRGRSVCCCLLDEAAFFRSEDSAQPDVEVLNAIRASMATFGNDGLVIIASSPYARRGILWTAYNKFYAKDDPRNLVWVADTQTMNPTITDEFIESEYERDAISAASEYGRDGTIQFRTDIEAYVDPEALARCVDDGVTELLVESNLVSSYACFCDPAEGSGADSFTCAFAHSTEEGIAVLDLVREWKPPFSPTDVVGQIADLMATYQISNATGDRWAGDFPVEAFKLKSVTLEQSAKPKSDIYRDVLGMINSQKVRLLDNKRLLSQFSQLERRTARGGKDSIDHPPGGHDDVCNAAAGALVLAGGRVNWWQLGIDYGEPQMQYRGIFSGGI